MSDRHLARAATTTLAAVGALLHDPRGGHVVGALDQANAAVDQLESTDVTGNAMRLLLAAIEDSHSAGSPNSPRLVGLVKTVLVALWADSRFATDEQGG